MQRWVELLTLRIVLSNFEAFENFVHDFSSHLLSFHVRCELVFDGLRVFLSLHSLQVSVLDCHSYSISYFEQIFSKLGDCELFFVFNHLTIALNCRFVFLDLLSVFYSCKLDFFLLALIVLLHSFYFFLIRLSSTCGFLQLSL